MAAGSWPTLPPHLEAAQEALGAIVTELALDPADQAEAQQLLISMLALSWFHVVHGPTVLRAWASTPETRAFREERRQHVVDLVVQRPSRPVGERGAGAAAGAARPRLIVERGSADT